MVFLGMPWSEISDNGVIFENVWMHPEKQAKPARTVPLSGSYPNVGDVVQLGLSIVRSGL